MKKLLINIYKKIKSILSVVRCKLYGMDYGEIIIMKRDKMTEKDHFRLIKNKGTKIYYEKGFRVFCGHHNIFLGSNIALIDTLINAGNTVGKVIIDDYVFFGHGVSIIARGHDYHFFNEKRQQSVTEKPIHIKEGAWIGSKAIILGGVIVGKHSVVAAGAVVKKDVPDYAIVGGNPAEIIKYIPHDEKL